LSTVPTTSPLFHLISIDQTFDACFHPDALSIAKLNNNKAFKDYLVHTALEHVEEAVFRLKPKGRKGAPPPTKDKVRVVKMDFTMENA
jgi:hypothetical protein